MNNVQTRRVIFAIFFALLMTTLLLMAVKASAVVVEQPDRTVKHLELRYAEPVPTKRHPHRVYFELNDGSAYRYLNSRVCLQANDVPNWICADVYWYAR